MWLAGWPCVCVCVCGNRLLEQLMSPSTKSQVMFASAFSWISDFFHIFGIHSFDVSPTFYTPGAYALTRSQAVRRPQDVTTMLGVSLRARWDTTLVLLMTMTWPSPARGNLLSDCLQGMKSLPWSYVAVMGIVQLLNCQLNLFRKRPHSWALHNVLVSRTWHLTCITKHTLIRNRDKMPPADGAT